MADDIRIIDLKTGAVENITNNIAQDIIPMWYENKIYFLSDRDRTMNLFVYDITTKQTRKVTNFTDYDIKFPSLGSDAIAFEQAGYIWLMDLKTEKTQKITIQIIDDKLLGRNAMVDASKYINSVDIAPDGSRLVVGARGEIFTVPAKSGITRRLTHTSNAHDRNAVWSPDGTTIAYISDMSGEFEIYIQKQDGSDAPIKITRDADTYMYSILWSPDSKKIVWSDKKLRLQYVDVQTKKVTQIAQSSVWEFGEYEWSHDSRYLAYSRPEANGMNTIWIYELATNSHHQVTDNWYASGQPVFSNDGKYLLFTSRRDFNPVYSQTEWNHAYVNMSRVYLVTLAESTPNPLAPENNEVKIEAEKPTPGADSKKDNSKNKEEEPAAEKKKPDLKIDFEGIAQRVTSLPVSPGNYWNLSCINNKIYYNETRSGGDGASLKMYDLKDRKETELGKNMSYTLSANAKKMLIQQRGQYAVIDLPGSSIALKEFVSLSDMNIVVNKAQEWKQIYDESWRQMRDFFYAPNMHGLDWNAMHKKYDVLVPFVRHRNDLSYLIGELIGELNVGHAYVGGGDRPEVARINMGLLGAKISRHSSGYFQIDQILKGENWSKNLRSPLTEMGINVKQGDFVTSVNGLSTRDVSDIYQLLINTAGRQVELMINSKPEPAGARKVIVVPVSDESNLYYFNWVQKNIEMVSKASNGQVGYIHVPNMVVEGLNEFAKYFYPQLDKKALIIDDRGNGGGNVSPMLIERLMREVTRANMTRNVTETGQTPRQMMVGPKVLLINQYSASDGDLFPYAFKKHKIGKVIGTRTWGGVVGIRGSLPFVDGGILNRPEFASYSSETSEWIIEGWGVDPDIMIDNDPWQEYHGKDAQLEKAIEVIMEELKNRKELPAIPAWPDKTK
jgi:tricorn protease